MEEAKSERGSNIKVPRAISSKAMKFKVTLNLLKITRM